MVLGIRLTAECRRTHEMVGFSRFRSILPLLIVVRRPTRRGVLE